MDRPDNRYDDDNADGDDHEAAFAAIVRRLGDPEDRRDRRRVIIGAVIGVTGLLLSLIALLVDWSPWVAAVGLPAMAAADLVGLITLKGWLARHRHRRP